MSIDTYQKLAQMGIPTIQTVEILQRDTICALSLLDPRDMVFMAALNEWKAIVGCWLIGSSHIRLRYRAREHCIFVASVSKPSVSNETLQLPDMLLKHQDKMNRLLFVPQLSHTLVKHFQEMVHRGKDFVRPERVQAIESYFKLFHLAVIPSHGPVSVSTV